MQSMTIAMEAVQLRFDKEEAEAVCEALNAGMDSLQNEIAESGHPDECELGKHLNLLDKLCYEIKRRL